MAPHLEPGSLKQAAEIGLRKLKQGNARFVKGEARFPTVCKETLASLVKKQKPFATILGCSDSRVPPELIFDANFGELVPRGTTGEAREPVAAAVLPAWALVVEAAGAAAGGADENRHKLRKKSQERRDEAKICNSMSHWDSLDGGRRGKCVAGGTRAAR